MRMPLAMYWSKGVWLKEYLTGNLSAFKLSD